MSDTQISDEVPVRIKSIILLWKCAVSYTHLGIHIQKENRDFSPLDNWISDNEWAINDFLDVYKRQG